MKLALDTGCAETLLIPGVLDDLGYSARDGESMTYVTTALGREPGYRLRLARFEALGFGFDDFLVHVHDLADAAGLDGLLGLDFLSRFNYEVRSKEGLLRVEPA